MGRTDEQLVTGYLAGDDGCLVELIRRYEEPLLRLLTRLTGDPGTAEDATQETFLAAACSLETLESPGAFRAWLYRIAYRKGVLAMTTNRRQPIPFSLLRDPQLVSTEDHPNRTPDEPPLRERFRRALERLEGEDRTILDLRFLDGFRHEDIARITGTSAGRVRQRVWILKKRLLDLLEGPQGAPA
jgi:RNA polymerase sigma-70 factor (ECF subfamily)